MLLFGFVSLLAPAKNENSDDIVASFGPITSRRACIATVNVYVPTGTDAREHVNVGLPPTAGSVHVKPLAAVADWKRSVLLLNTLKFTFVAGSGPAFVAVIVYVMVPSGATGSGASTTATDRSTCGLSNAVVTVFWLFAGFGSGDVPDG